MIYNSFDNVGLYRVLTFLKTHNDEYLSGQDLSDVLKISRVAVWKHIKRIKSLGYKIDSKQKLGYKLVKNTDLLLPWEITDGIKTKLIGKRAYYFDTIDSTQNFAAKISKNTKENGTVIISQKQTSGRGRLNRKWISPKGGIWLSIILHPKFDITFTTLIPIAASLALSLAIEKTLKKKPQLKWPNDVTIIGKKVAGMLVDLSIESNEIDNLILGVGINFKIDSKKLTKSLQRTERFYGVTSLTKTKEKINPIKLVHSFLFELEKVLDLLEHKKPKSIIKGWTKRASNIGKITTIVTSDGKIKGKALKIDNDGALVLAQKGKKQRLLVGDVV
ncbi:MAG: Biotin-protein ligase / Biotin operon repressor [Nitrosopumilales archaeon]|nr:MAG: Biotin-protein ligase / Biotin operon repressor [Nitrosopumilales archaeon]